MGIVHALEALLQEHGREKLKDSKNLNRNYLQAEGLVDQHGPLLAQNEKETWVWATRKALETRER